MRFDFTLKHGAKLHRIIVGEAYPKSVIGCYSAGEKIMQIWIKFLICTVQ